MVTMREVNAFWRTEFGGRDMVDLTVAPFGKVLSHNPVSYTHLDVYKRQALSWQK